MGEGGIDPERMMAAVGRFGHPAFIGARFAGHGDDWAALAMEPAPRLADEDGDVAFGPLATLLDMAAGLAVWFRAGRFSPHVTLDLRIDRLRPARPGRTIVARGACRCLVEPLAFIDGVAHDGDPDDPIARAAGTFMMTGRG